MTPSTRPLYHAADLERLINPKIVAVVGASETRGSFGERTLSNMSAFTGKVFAINPKYQTLLGRPCVPSLAEMPESPDCVVLCVARPMVEGMIEAAAAARAGGVVVYASGFAETAKPDRIEAQQRLIELAHRTGVRVVGPNCVGLANTRSGAGLNFMPDYAGMGHRRGPIGIVSQSGALGYTVLQGMERGIGFSHYLAAGNSCDVDVCDFISYLAEDDNTKAIICLLEGVKDGDRFLGAARKARDAGKALIVCKTGNRETSSKAAMSHTGTMVGSVVAYQTAISEAGAIAVDDLEAVLETASFFAKTSAPTRGRGVGILSTSGGAAVICADKAEAHDVALPALEAKTATALHQVVPDFGSVANPSDLTAEVLKTSETFGFCLDAFMNDSSFSALVMPMIFAHVSSSGARAPTIVEAADRTDRPLAVVWMNEWYQGPGSELLDADPKVCMFRSADRCFATLRAWFDWHEHRAPRCAGARKSLPSAEQAARAILIEARGRGVALSEVDSKRILACYGIATPKEILARDPAQAASAADQIGGPVAIKIVSPDILHKTEAGGVKLGLSTPEEVRSAAADILASAMRYAPRARIDGVSVQQMVLPGIEIVLGVKNDRQFGPLIAAGLGGIMVELLGDTTVRLAPVGDQAAHAMLASLKGHALLTGFRGNAGVDIDALADTICRLSELAHDLRDVVDQIDVNPVIASAGGVMAADALIVCR
ncbi:MULTISPECIES: acetate--CoA ligase family protein [Bradyrhizobium]|uniref:Acetyltransferase n=2 Tax=Bradyrhizobium TaxID=374 RepID=A0ABY0P8L1_9BRAD|nr:MULTISPECIES: acetate--CoA ligase family protein [Bradyrhizobium]SDH69302.1 acetyltransferase [Bradyrhizobium ottawaense]SEE14201.1 acetyltransferase [Bradyrhizobium lablabi]SHM10333.1 acetyltransferase [Bradyrhizobium lablabi]